MIPKVIHYCWFGRNPKPELADKCIRSWKKYCPDYDIIEWNEDNFVISSAPLYVRQAFEAKKWAFVADYVRLKVVYDNGGIYLDTDVELKKNLDCFLQYKAYFGFEGDKYINTGIGFGAEEKTEILNELMEDYRQIAFIKSSGEYDTTPCPQRNTEVFKSYGLRQNGKKQLLDDGTLILSSDYLCPFDYSTGKMKRSIRTVSIHWFSASWFTEEDKKRHHENQAKNRKLKRRNRIDNIKHLPNALCRKLVGKSNYEKLKILFKR